MGGLDAVQEGALLCDATGRVLHENAALTALLAAGPHGEAMRERIRELARAMRPLAPADALLNLPAVEEVRIAESTYRLVGSLVPERHAACPCGGVLVRVDRLRTPPPLEADATAELGLTRAEQRVAALMAQRRSDKRIAALLGISVHTARHHAAAIRAKLGVRSRSEVTARLLGVEQRLAA